MRYSQSADVSGAALNHVVEKTAIPAQEKIATLAHEKITLRKVPKTTKTPLTQLPNRMNGKMGKLSLMNRPYTKTRRTVIIFRSPRMR